MWDIGVKTKREREKRAVCDFCCIGLIKLSSIDLVSCTSVFKSINVGLSHGDAQGFAPHIDL